MFTGIYNTLVYALYPLVIKGYINKRKKKRQRRPASL